MAGFDDHDDYDVDDGDDDDDDDDGGDDDYHAQVLCGAHDSKEKGLYSGYLRTQSACEKVSK